jgi:hypothetical protein
MKLEKKTDFYKYHGNTDYTKRNSGDSKMEICQEHTGFLRSRCNLPSLRKTKKNEERLWS